MIGDIERVSSHKTVIVDEASMLTEEQLAALFDALSGVDRIILVGDPSQLPPIGAGRPFVDIVKLLTPESFTANTPRVGRYAELTIGSRQKGDLRQDLELAELFSGRSAGPGGDEIISRLGGGDCGPHLRICPWSSPAQLATLLPRSSARWRSIRRTSRSPSLCARWAATRATAPSTQFLVVGTRRGPLAGPLSGQGRRRRDPDLNRLIQAGFRAETRKRAQREDRRYAKVAAPQGATASSMATRSSISATIVGAGFSRPGQSRQ